MPITQRGWSVDSFAFSKVWFRTRCIDLRVCDIKKINSACKSWLYQDTFAKPEESVLYRPHQHGGLGLHTVKFKSLAGFITTFLQTAVNTTFRPNLLHNLLYGKHVLGENVRRNYILQTKMHILLQCIFICIFTIIFILMQLNIHIWH